MNGRDDPLKQGGKNDKYEWTQSEEELDVYVYVPKGEGA
jgi:hypothetical protein